MSFDLPANIERDLERYAQAEHISPSEAAVKFIPSGLKSSKRKAARTDVVSDAYVEAYYDAFPGFKTFADLTNEQWDGVLKNAQGMTKQGLATTGRRSSDRLRAL